MLFVAAILCGCASGPRWTRQTFAFSLPSDPPATISNTNLVALHRVSISPLFQSRSFTYRTAENSYEQDPYAGFLIPPEQALAESIRAWMRASGAFGTVVRAGQRPGPELGRRGIRHPTLRRFSQASQPVGTHGDSLHMLYEVNEGVPGRIVLDKVCARETPLASQNARCPHGRLERRPARDYGGDQFSVYQSQFHRSLMI